MKVLFACIAVLFFNTCLKSQELVTLEMAQLRSSDYSEERLETKKQTKLQQDSSTFVLISQVEKSSFNFNLSLYPNPVQTTLYIKQASFELLRGCILDQEGNLLTEYIIDHGETQIDLSSFRGNQYFIEVSSFTGEEYEVYALQKLKTKH